MRALTCLAVILSISATATAQSPPRATTLHAEVGLPGASPARFVNVTVEMGAAPWAMEGCVASAAGTCRATQRVVLTEAERASLRAHLDALARVPLCEPEGFAPGDPPYTFSIPGRAFAGHLPARVADLPARTAGPCGAPARLAWWIAQRFTAGTR